MTPLQRYQTDLRSKRIKTDDEDVLVWIDGDDMLYDELVLCHHHDPTCSHHILETRGTDCVNRLIHLLNKSAIVLRLNNCIVFSTKPIGIE